jgi:hypothetical protein
MAQKAASLADTRRRSYQASRRSSYQSSRRSSYQVRRSSRVTTQDTRGVNLRPEPGPNFQYLFRGKVFKTALWLYDKQRRVRYKLKRRYEWIPATRPTRLPNARKVYRYSRNIRTLLLRNGDPRYNPAVHQAVRVGDWFYDGCKVIDNCRDQDGNEKKDWVLKHMAHDGERLKRPWGKREKGVWKDGKNVRKVFIGYTNMSHESLHDSCIELDFGYNYHDGEKLNDDELLLENRDVDDDFVTEPRDLPDEPDEYKTGYHFFDQNCNHFVRDLLEECVVEWKWPYRTARSDRIKDKFPNLVSVSTKVYDAYMWVGSKWRKLPLLSAKEPEKAECHACKCENDQRQEEDKKRRARKRLARERRERKLQERRRQAEQYTDETSSGSEDSDETGSSDYNRRSSSDDS